MDFIRAESTITVTLYWHTKKLVLSVGRFSEMQENALYDARRISSNCPVGSSFRFYWLSFHTSHLLSRQNCLSLSQILQPLVFGPALNLSCSCLRLPQWSPNWFIYFFFSLFSNLTSATNPFNKNLTAISSISNRLPPTPQFRKKPKPQHA